jgi:nucleoside-diphosphate-sugar epimerase
VVIKKLNILVIGNGYIASSLKYDKEINFNLSLLPKNKLNTKKKFKNIHILIHPIGLNRHNAQINPKKAILVKKNYTDKIINFAKKNSIKKIIYVSTAGVYANDLNGTIDENTKCKNRSPYALSHLKAESILKKKANSRNLKIIIIRLANLFGIRNKKNKSQYVLVVNQFLKQAISNKKIIVQDKYTVRNFIPMNYFTKKIEQLSLLNDKFQIVNISYNTYTLLYIAKLISKRMRKLFNYQIKINLVDSNNKRKKFLFYKSCLNKKKPSSYFLIKEIDKSLKILTKNK